MIKSITLISHCWCPPGCDIYAQHLKWQLASLVLHPPKRVSVLHMVCVTREDKRTEDAIRDIYQHATIPETVTIQPWPFEPEEILRRAIGRNVVAKQTECDAVWWCDADYCFGDGCLDTLADQIDIDTELACPKSVMVNDDHATGDKMIEDNRDNPLPDIDPSLFEPLKRGKAIGGLQIVGGNVARERGYLDGTKWVEPVATDKGWRKTDEDVAFRRGRKLTTVSLPNLYWIRHTVKGQDLDAEGKQVGKAAW